MNYMYNISSSEVENHVKREPFLFSGLIVVGLSVTLIISMFFKESWLWMDEVLAYTLLSDPSLAHMNNAIISNLDANPPLFFNVYWVLGHSISLNPYFLRAVSIVLFAVTIALLHRYTTRLVGTARVNFVLFLLVTSLTYLNFTLSTQIRSYSFYLILSCAYFMVAHQLIRYPAKAVLLGLHLLVGLALVMTHNFGSFYVGASLSFFGLLWLWSKQRAYGVVLLSHALVFGLWFLLWFPNFRVQSQAAKPHTWIPLPTVLSFFNTLGELVPNLSARIEQLPGLTFLPMVRVAAVVGLFLYIALPRLKQGFRALIADEAFSFYVLSGYIALTVAGMTLLVSYGYKSVFLSRYQWPTFLLVLFQFTYAYHHFVGARQRSRHLTWLLSLSVIAMLGFMFYQNKKLVLFPKAIVSYLPNNQAHYPVFFESADYFLPLHHYNIANAHFLLSWQTALLPANIPNATVDYKIVESLHDKYGVDAAVPVSQFTKAHFPHFYVVDEASRYQIEDFIAHGRVKVIRSIPIPIKGHRLLECSF